MRGFSLFETLFSTGVGFVVLLVAAVLVLKQAEELNSLRDRIEVNSLQLEIQRALMDPAQCLETFKSPFAIEDTETENPSYSQPLARIAGPTSPVVEVGTSLSGTAAQIQIARIDAVHFSRLSDNLYRFDVKVFLNSTGTSILPITIHRLRVATQGDKSKTVTSCHPDAESSDGSLGKCRKIETASAIHSRIAAYCERGERLLNGGGVCVPTGEASFLRTSQPVMSEGRYGWEVECGNDSANAPRAKAYAYCCT